MDDLVQFLVIIFFALTAFLVNWLKRRGEDRAGGPPAQPRSPEETDQPPPASSWEEELRRLLEGKSEEPRVPPPRPPPIVVHEPTPAAPPPAPQTWTPSGTQAAPTPPPVPSMMTAEDYERRLAEEQAELEHLRQRTRAFEQVERIEAPVARSSRAIELARQWVKRPDSLRAAMVVSVILGPPKGLDEQTTF